MNIFIILVLIAVPLILLYNRDRGPIKLLGPVIISYAIGLLIGNTMGFDIAIPKMASEASIPLAIPLLLISCDFMAWLKNSNKTIISFGLVLVSVLVVSTVVSFSYAQYLPEYKKLAAMMVGVYTGGTPNMSAIGLAVNISSETFVLLNTADVILGGIYLLFIFTFGKTFFGKILLPSCADNAKFLDTKDKFTKLSFKFKLKRIFLFIIIAALSLGLALGLSQLFFGADNVAFIILFISVVGIALSFSKSISKLAGSYEVGEYLLLIFCISIGMMANLTDLMNASFTIIGYAAIVMFGSILVHTILCKVFKIDRDTAIITSVAGIFGPPFVAPVAESIGNRQLMVAGITSGLIGYSVGNFLGLGLYYFIS